MGQFSKIGFILLLTDMMLLPTAHLTNTEELRYRLYSMTQFIWLGADSIVWMHLTYPFFIDISMGDPAGIEPKPLGFNKTL